LAITAFRFTQSEQSQVVTSAIGASTVNRTAPQWQDPEKILISQPYLPCKRRKNPMITAALASVAWPQSGTSTVGVNQRK
jgi:hypothetical protein